MAAAVHFRVADAVMLFCGVFSFVIMTLAGNPSNIVIVDVYIHASSAVVIVDILTVTVIIVAIILI